jgi:hypothetical protein
MQSIELSDSTYDRLLKRVVSFEDRPEDVILRLLNAEESIPAPESDSKAGGRAAPGSILPVEDYWVPVLQVLVEAGGEAPSNDVVDALAEKMSDVLGERDWGRLESGEIRWRNRARFARLRMKEQGLISDTSRRGVWAITDLGRQYLAMREEVDTD